MRAMGTIRAYDDVSARGKEKGEKRRKEIPIASPSRQVPSEPGGTDLEEHPASRRVFEPSHRSGRNPE
jgi:hypothetical protein